MVAVRELVTQFQNNYRSKLTEAKIIIAALHDLKLSIKSLVGLNTMLSYLKLQI